LRTLPRYARTLCCRLSRHARRPGGPDQAAVSTSRQHNIQLPTDRSEADFVAFRQARDAKLDAPTLLYPSLQVNIRGGHLPEPARSGATTYLKIPLRLKTAIDGLG